MNPKSSRKILFAAIFAGSFFLNIALVSALVSNLQPTTEASPAAKSAPTAGHHPSQIDAQIWPTLQTDDLPSLVARLRESGFPPDVIRAIIAAQLRETYNARRKALDPDGANRPFWKNTRLDPAAELALRQLSREQSKLMRSLLGEDESANPMNAVFQDRQLRGVPPEKVNDVRQLLRDFNDKRSDIYANGVVVAADRDKLNAIDKDQRAALAQLLTPAELNEYELTTGNTADQLRHNLSAFSPSEAEFRAIFALQRPFDEQYQNMFYGGGFNQDEMMKRNTAQKDVTDQIKAALGPDRAADYTRETDYNYVQTNQLVARLELPPETTAQVWAVQQDIQGQVKSINTDRSLSQDQRTQALAALADDAKTKITATLGDQGFEAYKQYGGSWMQMLHPRTTRPGGNGSR